MMNEHVQHLLAAYYDGELTKRQQDQVAAHLPSCPACQAELESLSVLSSFLQAEPLPELRTSPDQFVAQVGLQLPRREKRPIWQRGLNGLWMLIPVALLAFWLFIQTVLTQTLLLDLAIDYGFFNDLQLLLGADRGSSQLRPFVWNTLLSGVTAMALLGWLASWWVRGGERSAKATE